MEQIAQRAAEGRPAIAAFNNMIDNQEAERASIEADLNALPTTPAIIKAPVISASVYKAAIDAVIASVKHKSDEHLDP